MPGIGLVAIESAADGISLRTGCFCNPGAGEQAFNITRRTLRGNQFNRTLGIDEYLTTLGLPTGGAIRVSFGVASTIADVQRFLAFAEQTYRDRPSSNTGPAPRTR